MTNLHIDGFTDHQLLIIPITQHESHSGEAQELPRHIEGATAQGVWLFFIQGGKGKALWLHLNVV